MSGALENRAAVFTSKPQAVEVYQAGAWWPGELLGWRHTSDGSCQVWVRVVLGGVEEAAWTDLETLRLPERHLAVATGSTSCDSGERELAVARHPSSRCAVGTDSEHTDSATAVLPMVRELTMVPDAIVAPAGGRRRAPDVPAAGTTGGRRRAPEEAAAPTAAATAASTSTIASTVASPAASTGGRRRAPETTPVPGAGGRRTSDETVAAPTGGRRRAPDQTAAAAAPGGAVLVGRHSPTISAASARAGRHRTADTGLLAAVTDATVAPADGRRAPQPTTPGRGPAVAVADPAEPAATAGGDPAGSWSAPSGLESDLLTRPMRLSDHRPHARRPRPDGVRRGL